MDLALRMVAEQSFLITKKNYLVLMAVVDANYRFMMCDVGGLGSDSDGACIQATSFYKKNL